MVDLIVEVPPPDVPLVGKEQVTPQAVQALALVELPPDPSAQFFIGDVTAEVDRSHEPAVLVKRFG